MDSSSFSGSLAVVGNPNTGKTTLFNALTGLSQKTGNYPGVTVEKKTGTIRLANGQFEALDLPGTYSLAAASPDELVVPSVLHGIQEGAKPVSAILVVADATSLHRNLYLVSQLMELNLPMIMALNMVDLAKESQIVIDLPELSRRLGFPVIATHATRSGGLVELREAIGRVFSQDPPAEPGLFSDFAETRDQLTSDLSGKCKTPIPPTMIFRALFDERGHTARHLKEIYGEDILQDLLTRRAELTEEHGKLIELETRVRYTWIRKLLRDVVSHPELKVVTRSERVDKVLTHKLWGPVTLLIVLTILFQSIYSWAGPLMDLIEGQVGNLGTWIGSFLAEGMLKSLVVDGIIGGVGAVLVFLPQIVLLFFFVAILEDCGYMARAAFLLDRVFSRVGLSGKSLIPLLSSFACAIPGIMATRTIESRADRLTTILVAPLMSCSARLPVYVILISAFLPEKKVLGVFGLQGLVLLMMYMVGIVIAVPVAWLLKRKLLQGNLPPFLMELPSYKIPSSRTVGIRVYQSASAFVKRAGTTIFAVAVLVWALAYFPRPESVRQEHANQRVEATAQRHEARLALLFDYAQDRFPQGTDEQALESILRADKELAGLLDGSMADGTAELTRVVSSWKSLDADYAVAISAIDREEDGAYLRTSYIGRAGQLIEPVVAPLGWDWRIGMAAIASFPAREIIIATLGVIFNLGSDQDESSAELQGALRSAERSDGSPLFNIPVALSIMIFFALCAQCAATLVTIRKETGGWRWAVFSFTYMTTLAYLAAFVVYQVTSALGWGA